MCLRIVLCFTLVSLSLFQGLNSEESSNFFLKASKSVPRIGRSNNKNGNNADFENFFLKASKSVPRIGRRNQISYSDDANDEDVDSMGKLLRYPTWSEIADKFEYYPELFNAESLEKLEKELGDDPSIYEWDKVRVKRKIPTRFMLNQE